LFYVFSLLEDLTHQSREEGKLRLLRKRNGSALWVQLLQGRILLRT